MTDMRRTLLWVVFSMSLFLIYDAWMRHTGQPSFFSPLPPKTAASAAWATAAGSAADANAEVASSMIRSRDARRRAARLLSA